MNEKNKEIAVKIIMIIIVYFLFAKPILKIFGKGKGAKNYEDEIKNSLSPFLPNLWKRKYYILGMPANGKQIVSLEQYERLVKAQELIVDSFGFFTDDEEQFFRGLQLCKNQSEVSLMAEIMQLKNNKALLQLMRSGKGGLPNNGLSDGEINSAIDFVKNLPL